MTLGEFKAWLDGYAEGFGNGAPTPEQWAKVREKLDGVEMFRTTVSDGHVYIPSTFRLDDTGHNIPLPGTVTC